MGVQVRSHGGGLAWGSEGMVVGGSWGFVDADGRSVEGMGGVGSGA